MIDRRTPEEKKRTDERILISDIHKREARRSGRGESLGTIVEPARSVPIYAKCDVLVVGGGPSGTAAAVAAARLGAQTILLERYNHLGGLSTGGLVIWIDRMTDWQGELVIRGFGEEALARLPDDAIAGPPRKEWGSQDEDRVAYWAQRTAAYRGVVTWSPTIDPERLKLVSQQMVMEAGARLVYHSWAAEPIVENGRCTGVLFENKAGRHAILANVVVDATGDGDIYSRAGAASESDFDENDVHGCMNTSWLWGGVDMKRWIDFRQNRQDDYNAFMARGREAVGLFERAFVSWREDVALFMGPRLAGYSAIDIDDQTEVEVRSHQLMDKHLQFYRANAPGFENAYLMLSAPQLGVRHTRRLVGTGRVTRAQWPTGLVHADEIGVTPCLSPAFPNVSIPYGSLVPEKLDGLLACGRHIACDTASHGYLREIPQCWITGQAAGAAAALAANAGVQPRAVDMRGLQSALARQGVYLRPTETVQAAAAG